MASDRKLNRPDSIAGFILSPLNTVSDSHPASTVPSTPNTAEKAIICDAASIENIFSFCRNSTPHPATAYLVIYTNADEAEIIHIPGCFSTSFWT